MHDLIVPDAEERAGLPLSSMKVFASICQPMQ
jgi:hypothetical protein